MDAIAEHLVYVTQKEIRNLMVNVPPRQTKPVSVNAIVLEKHKGHVPLKEIATGDFVLTHRGRFRRVDSVHEQGVLPLLQLETYRGRLLNLAYDHPVLTTRGWIEAENLVPGDVLAEVHPTEKCGTRSVSNEEARSFGYLIGSRDSYTNKVPDSILRGTEDEIANFLGAYWACAGDLEKKSIDRGDWSISCDSVSKELLMDIQRLLVRMGISSYIIKKTSNLKTQTQSNVYGSYALLITDQDNAARFIKSIPIVHAKGSKGILPNRIHFDRPIKEDILVAIRETAAGECRCLTVEEDSSFTAEDLAVHNSSLVSVLWPVWHWLQNPETQFIFASYDQALVERDAGNSRRLIESGWFRERYATDFYILPDDNRKEMYRNNCGGYRLSTSVNGRATGEGGDIQCFPAGTMVSTECGYVPIERLFKNQLLIKSWDGSKVRLSKQIGFHISSTEKLLVIRIGEVAIKSTPEHPFFVKNRGWVMAQDLKCGDVLYAIDKSNMRSMFKEILSFSRTCNASKNWYFLFSSMLRYFRTWREKPIKEMYRWFNKIVRSLWQWDTRETFRREEKGKKDLFTDMQVNIKKEKFARTSNLFLRNMLICFRIRVWKISKKILFFGMCSYSSQHKNEWEREWQILAWSGIISASEFPSLYKVDNTLSRRLPMPSMFYERGKSWTESGHSSYQLHKDRPQRSELGIPMSFLSRQNARQDIGPSKMDEVLVESIESIDEKCEVFCIDVEKDHNFFANGVLVHNCLDDPHNAQKVESSKVRLSALSWNDNSWRSRNNDPNKSQKVYVGQRSHDSDLFGHTLQLERKRWVVVSLPMEFEVSNRCITYLNDGTGDNHKKEIFRDPRKKEGELLNPSRFNLETVKNEKKAMSDRAWNAQYQQRPEGQQGLILKRNWWRQWIWPEWHKEAGRQRPLPDFFEIIQVYDTALEEGEQNDFTARTTWGFFEHEDSLEDIKTGKISKGEPRVCGMLLDRYKGRPGFPELRELAVESAELTGPDKILIEKKVSGHSLIQELRRKRLPVVGVKVIGDLTFRAHMASLVLEKGCIFYIPRTWSFDTIDSCAKFPLGDHDDDVSSCVMAWQYMRRYHDLMLPDEKNNDTIDPFRWKKVTYA